MGWYLLDHRPRVTQFFAIRRNRGRVTGTYDVHTFESFPDWLGPDTGVENAVNYLRTRTTPGTYHDAVDSDSHIPVMPWWYEAFHDRFTNNWAVSVSIATQAHKWGQAPKEWREAALRNAARVAAMRADEIYLCTDLSKVAAYKIDIPAKWLTQAEAHAKHPGFVRHGTSDPGRRSDPWPNNAPEANEFLEYYKGYRKTGQYAKVSLPSSGGGTSVPVPTTPPPAPKPKSDVYAPLILDGVRGPVTITAWQILLAAINKYNGRIDGIWGPLSIKAEQVWLKGLGYYDGLIDGVEGPMTIKGLQRFLKSKGRYSGLIDGRRGPLTVKGEQRYLNDQRRYL